MIVVETKDLVKIYHDRGLPVKALDRVSLSVKEGEFTAIAGPSGSGKTTLLNLIGGLDTPTSGEILLAGKNLKNMRRSELAEFRLRNIGFIFQTYNLIPVLTALENVELVLMLQGVQRRERREKAEEALKMVGLGDFLHRKPDELSGGQQQRVAVARAIVSKPKLILADEPTANLDSSTGENLIQLMKELNEKHGTTFIFSTHDSMVMKEARRLVLLRDGKIVEDRTQNRT